MKVTDSKDLVKVSQIRPIMQEYFGISMDLARIKLMAYMLHALCGVQTVSLHKLVSAMPASVERDSNLRCGEAEEKPTEESVECDAAEETISRNSSQGSNLRC